MPGAARQKHTLRLYYIVWDTFTDGAVAPIYLVSTVINVSSLFLISRSLTDIYTTIDIRFSARYQTSR